MSLIYHDGFDGSRWTASGGGAAAYLLRQGWSTYGNPGSGQTPRQVTGRDGSGYALDTDSFWFNDPRLPLPNSGSSSAPYTTLRIGFGIVYTSGQMMCAARKSGSDQVTLLMTASREVQVRAGGSGGTVVATSSTNVLPATGFCYVEVSLTGTHVEVRVDEAVVVASTAITYPGGAGLDEFVMGRTSGFDDLYLVTDDDADFPTGYLGDATSLGVLVSSDSGPNDWSPSTGTDNYALLATSPDPLDDDATYVSTSSDSQTELYGISTPATGFDVAGVTLRVMCRRTSGGAGQVELLIKENGNTHADTAFTPNSSGDFTIGRFTAPIVPGGANWTVADAVAADWGFRTTTGVGTTIRASAAVVDILLVAPALPPIDYDLNGVGDLAVIFAEVLAYTLDGVGDLGTAYSSPWEIRLGGSIDAYSTGGIPVDPPAVVDFLLLAYGDLRTDGGESELTAYRLEGVGDLSTEVEGVRSYTLSAAGGLRFRSLPEGRLDLLALDVYRR